MQSPENQTLPVVDSSQDAQEALPLSGNEATPQKEKTTDPTARGHEIFAAAGTKIRNGFNSVKNILKGWTTRHKDFATQLKDSAIDGVARGVGSAVQLGETFHQKGVAAATECKTRFESAQTKASGKINAAVEGFQRKLYDRQVDQRFSSPISAEAGRVQQAMAWASEQRAQSKAQLQEAYRGGNTQEIQQSLLSAQDSEGEIFNVISQANDTFRQQVGELHAQVAEAKKRFGVQGEIPSTAQAA